MDPTTPHLWKSGIIMTFRRLALDRLSDMLLRCEMRTPRTPNSALFHTPVKITGSEGIVSKSIFACSAGYLSTLPAHILHSRHVALFRNQSGSRATDIGIRGQFSTFDPTPDKIRGGIGEMFDGCFQARPSTQPLIYF